MSHTREKKVLTDDFFFREREREREKDASSCSTKNHQDQYVVYPKTDTTSKAFHIVQEYGSIRDALDENEIFRGDPEKENVYGKEKGRG